MKLTYGKAPPQDSPAADRQIQRLCSGIGAPFFYHLRIVSDLDSLETVC